MNHHTINAHRTEITPRYYSMAAAALSGCGCGGGGGAVTLVVVLFSVLHLLMSFGVCTDSLDVHCSNTTSANEVKSLREIARQVRKPDWNCSADPCINISTPTCWNTKDDWKFYTNSINCTCHNSRWHVSDINWRGQNLTGILPRSLRELPYLKRIDLSRNVLTGTIPRGWADAKLEFVSLFANRLSGPIPKYLGNITTLINLSIESNQFNGTIPPELGNLVYLSELTLNDNKLTGKLPLELKNLANLRVLRLSSNNFNGSLPDHFENYSKLQKLEMIGSGFEGPIPSSISFLHNINELRIGDLNGEGSKFPPLRNLTKLNTLVLRNCNITGGIPQYIGNMQKLKDILDLSFNKLTGSVPYIPALKDLILTSNMLNGPIPSWITDTNGYSHVDLSYNNFDDTLVESLCNRGTLNLYRCNARQKTLDSSACLRSLRCSKARYSLHINCGGQQTTIGKITYEQDSEPNGNAEFFRNSSKKADWGFSSTGEFWKAEVPTNIARNSSILRMNDTQLYKEARISATSLTYYGRCLAKGNYTVTLSFSEIVFTDDGSYTSSGRRVFDIFIQEKLYAKDFDIAKEANGTNKAVNKTFRNIPVTKSIEVRFHYTGKGSIRVPDLGNYGPLISAISVESQSNPPFDWKIVKWVLIGVTSCLFVIVVGIFWWKRRMANIRAKEQELRVLNPQIGLFAYKQIKSACNNFNAASKLGEGGFGPVFKGTLSDGTHIAVKQLSAKSSQGNREFVNEIGMISSLYHPNLVRLYGCCVDTSQLVLVYEYMENKDLGHALFDHVQLRLDWPTRKRICTGIARGLAFLHEETRIKMIHRDIKATNILLDRDLNPKISDFGLAKLNEEDVTHISTRAAGTIGYMAPEYALRGYLTPKADVYSFGVVVLEVMAGRSNMKFLPEEDYFCLLDWAFVLKQKGDLMELMDPTLGTDYNKEEASIMIQVALLCTNPSPALRPTMSAALNMLEGNIAVQELILEPNKSYGHELMYLGSKKLKQLSVTETETESQSQSLIHTSEAARTDSFFTRSLSSFS
ncbi:probable LRR receptor-like serine/threonine-protein kinase At1g07650 isoform X2 [Spinacia oleracea]|uniref:non-specific serine/threonine protein kinase n=1 Tax=Spinacia oleracea TaxID=3562 RepID=A0ABM3RT40_SPIOL|nr:probable LRR receptor-like serine/threonine-protein kinase At1g07650 isoform X2 [Spinacia oleracea]